MFRVLLCPSSGARDYDVDCHIGRFYINATPPALQNETTNVVINITVASS